MISDRALGIAVERAVVTAEQAEALHGIEREIATLSVQPAPADAFPREQADDEALRFISGFADIFVTIGIALFIGALFYIMDEQAGLTMAFAASAGAAWLLAEFFTRRRRQALPSIVLLIVFVVGAFEVLAYTFAILLPASVNSISDNVWMLPTTNGAALILAGLGTMGFAALHYYRFRVPITIAAGMAAFGIVALGVVVSITPDLSRPVFNGLVLVCGLLTFALAMYFDLSDPSRATRRTDIAFWLHLLAAPLIVHTLIRGFLHGLDGDPTTTGAIGVLAVFLLIGIVAVIIDRRAILVSGLLYAGIAFGALIKTLGFSGSSLLIPVVLLTLGGFILLLSAGWHPLRRTLLGLLPPALARKLPHPLVASAS
ncbi:hypothetical protein [Beijerinckia sp. L45]|uniref:hypothetical protein n=1 Tax=Beijerinckia sp. L45 TaxID=1641855 RepID=UPI001FEE505E|nr:hypothetical protein [Beijerinckia sp. L45]